VLQLNVPTQTECNESFISSMVRIVCRHSPERFPKFSIRLSGHERKRGLHSLRPLNPTSPPDEAVLNLCEILLLRDFAALNRFKGRLDGGFSRIKCFGQRCVGSDLGNAEYAVAAKGGSLSERTTMAGCLPLNLRLRSATSMGVPRPCRGVFGQLCHRQVKCRKTNKTGISCSL
jgi:hypothetical protein